MSVDDSFDHSFDHMGRSGFISRFGLWTDEQAREASDIVQRVSADGIETIRLSFADQHGVLRGKSVMAQSFPSVLRNGCTITTTLLLKDTSHRTVYPVWEAGAGLDSARLTGAADAVMVPIPGSFRVLPWAPETAWMLCDLYYPDGAPVAFSTRDVARTQVERLRSRGFNYMSGLEIECHVFRVDESRNALSDATQPAASPALSVTSQGYQYLTEARLDELEPVMQPIRKALLGLGLPLRTLEVEFGPSQIELTLEPAMGLETADAAVLTRSAIKQVCQRNGLLATFMCRPLGPNLFSSGWHVHQSLWDVNDGNNAFTPDCDDRVLSDTGYLAVAGLLRSAPASCALTTPTVNGYKRYQPYSLAPDRASWGIDNRGAMLRIIAGAGDPGSRIENRVGEPAANPYLYAASQIAGVLDGLAIGEQPPPPADSPYDTPATPLPKTLREALGELDNSAVLRGALGDAFVDYFLTIKRAEVARFDAAVTDWEQREYLTLF